MRVLDKTGTTRWDLVSKSKAKSALISSSWLVYHEALGSISSAEKKKTKPNKIRMGVLDLIILELNVLGDIADKVF